MKCNHGSFTGGSFEDGAVGPELGAGTGHAHTGLGGLLPAPKASRTLSRLATASSMLTRCRPSQWDGHLQNAGVGAALKGPASPLTAISLSPSMGSPGARNRPPEPLLELLPCPWALLCLENTSVLCTEPAPLLSAQPLPLLSLLLLTLSSPTLVQSRKYLMLRMFRDLVNISPLLCLNSEPTDE